MSPRCHNGLTPTGHHQRSCVSPEIDRTQDFRGVLWDLAPWLWRETPVDLIGIGGNLEARSMLFVTILTPFLSNVVADPAGGVNIWECLCCEGADLVCSSVWKRRCISNGFHVNASTNDFPPTEHLIVTR